MTTASRTPASAGGRHAASAPASGPPSSRSGPGVDPDAETTTTAVAGSAVPETVVSRVVGAVLLVGGLIGAFMAVTLLLEKLELLADPTYVPSCSIDPVLSCGTIMRTAQASVLGFPNPVIGVVAFPVVAAMGALVLSRVALPRWTWFALMFGATVGVGFVLWLVLESLTVIHALCPYCMVVWAATTAIFWYTASALMERGELGGGAVADFVVRRTWVVVGVTWLVVAAAVVASFPGYFLGV